MIDLLDLLGLPLTLQALAGRFVVACTVAWCAERHRCDKPSIDSPVQAIPLCLERPCLVPRNRFALCRCRGLCGTKSGAEERECWYGELHDADLLAQM
jgi:hypothetical protein